MAHGDHARRGRPSDEGRIPPTGSPVPPVSHREVADPEPRSSLRSTPSRTGDFTYPDEPDTDRVERAASVGAAELDLDEAEDVARVGDRGFGGEIAVVLERGPLGVG